MGGGKTRASRMWHKALSAQVNRNCKYDFLRSGEGAEHILSQSTLNDLTCLQFIRQFFLPMFALHVMNVKPGERQLFSFYTAGHGIIECKC